MAGTSTKVQAAKTKGNQDLSESDESVDDLRSLLFPDYADLYTGPGAHSARELQEELGLATHERARHRARKAVMAGVMVEVKVLRNKSNGAEYVTTGWVVKAEYDEWGRESERQDARNQRG